MASNSSNNNGKGETQQAFRSLIESVTTGAQDGSGPKSNLTPDAIQRLTDKLSELVGFDAIKDFTPQRNERGELVNEEGLPIIDITEPLSNPESENLAFVDNVPLIPLDKQPSEVRERLRRQRNQILDELEAEEQREKERELQKEREEYEEIIRKKVETAANEKEKSRAVKDLQKKMGKALLRNMAESKEKEEKEKDAQRLKDEEQDAKRKAASGKKKNVSFAAGPEVVSGEEEEDWGDLTPARLHSTNRQTLLSERQQDRHPMKLNVVERHPIGKFTAPAMVQPQRDSDDESESEGEEELANARVEGIQRKGTPPPSRLADLDEDEDEENLEEELDLDYASLQREIELEYHRKRAIVGQTAAASMRAYSHSDDEHDDEKGSGIVVGDETKPAMSQFRASRLASAYGASTPSSSSSIADFVVPASSIRTVQGSIRTGKLDAEGKLIGGEDDSASEAENEGVQEVLELLKKGEAYNIGPNGEYLSTIPPRDVQASSSLTSEALRLDGSKSLPPLTTRIPASKFKLSRTAAGRPSDSGASSPSDTPINHIGRSSPKGSSPLSSSVQLPFIPPQPPTVPPQKPIVLNSPSFPSPSISHNPSGSSAPSFSMIVDSPSFPPPLVKGSQSVAAAPAVPPARKSSRPDRPPTVLASTVREVKPISSSDSAEQVANASRPSNEQPKQKVSRFKQDRM